MTRSREYAPETGWIEYLSVEHWARSESSRFRVQDLCYDYIDPPIAHRLDVQVPETAAPSTAESLPADLEPGQKLGRILVNEFPLHLHADSGDPWFWFFDRCEAGPTAHLGGAIDFLLKENRIDLGPEMSGAVLHLQNLEVHPDYRRLGIGRRLVRYALALLSRSEQDVAVAETETVRPMYSPLFPDPDAAYSPSIRWEEPGVIRAFMNSVGFRRIESTKRLEEEVLPEDYSPPGPLFYRQVTAVERTRWLEGNLQ